MNADVGQGGELNAALIPGPNHPKPSRAEALSGGFVGSAIAWLVFVGLYGLYVLVEMALHKLWWPLAGALVFLGVLSLLNHFNPGKLP